MRPHFLILALAAVSSACSTAPTNMDSPDDATIACTLEPDELSARREQLLPGRMRRAEQVTDLQDGVRMEFKSSPGLLAELAGIIDSERTCCSFLRFHLTAEPGTGPVTFEVTGPPGTREVLRSL
ncbi:MAG TPA: hypothetical protein VMS76_07275 [Planctomycetota bacterium]|nr:hypothetical protein [Planctomycetota bacterium]